MFTIDFNMGQCHGETILEWDIKLESEGKKAETEYVNVQYRLQ